MQGADESVSKILDIRELFIAVMDQEHSCDHPQHKEPKVKKEWL
ncbi:hypothetical protein SynWH8101_1328 [Synechococcus sp. WH 8101]|nr:hypothetical protein SynWH8101_1328 [Synechococcus sp. WH 8101]QNI45143.1 hypothetical protein SynRCC2555_01360 [Synechococcus sp. WH 8101]